MDSRRATSAPLQVTTAQMLLPPARLLHSAAPLPPMQWPPQPAENAPLAHSVMQQAHQAVVRSAVQANMPMKWDLDLANPALPTRTVFLGPLIVFHSVRQGISPTLLPWRASHVLKGHFPCLLGQRILANPRAIWVFTSLPRGDPPIPPAFPVAAALFKPCLGSPVFPARQGNTNSTTRTAPPAQSVPAVQPGLPVVPLAAGIFIRTPLEGLCATPAPFLPLAVLVQGCAVGWGIGAPQGRRSAHLACPGVQAIFKGPCHRAIARTAAWGILIPTLA